MSIFEIILLGVALAMDAFSVSVVNGLTFPKMKAAENIKQSTVFAVFQFAMPLIGWICIHTIVEYFTSFGKAIPWAAFILLSYIGGKMLIDAYKSKKGEVEEAVGDLGMKALLIQGVATSIDALSVGFTISDFVLMEALFASVIIGVVTFVICVGGVYIGKKVGTKLSSKANLIGGLVLIGIGVKILLESLLA